MLLLFADINVQNPRGVTVTGAQGPLYLYGSAAEHSLLYQFSFEGAANVVQVRAFVFVCVRV